MTPSTLIHDDSPSMFDLLTGENAGEPMASGEIIVDSFAGGGGASLGISWALGRGPDIAINHDAEAIALHQANHPESEHYTEDVWQVDPVEACAGRPVGLMWLSPDCKHFSKAKGGKPVSKRVRGLAWVAVRWAKAVAPRVIVLENVEEFQTWGPVGDDGRPCPEKKGLTFRRFCSRLRNLGYAVEWRELRACDYGAPTIRKRLFLIARRDGADIVWPKPSHGKGRAHPWRTAAECIDWSIPCPSIFTRTKPLAENTQRRIAAGLKRYVIDSPNPFVVNMAHGGKVENIDAPLSTIATENGGCRALAVPFVTPMQHQNRPVGVDEPLQTVTTQGNKFNLVAPVVVKYQGAPEGAGSPASLPMPTVTANGFIKRPGGAAPLAVMAPYLVPRYGEREGQEPRARSVESPMPVVVPTQNGGSLAAAFMAKHFSERKSGQVQAASLADPAPTVTTVDHNALVTATLGREDHSAAVHAFLVAYFGNEKDGGSLHDPMRTVTSRDRFGLVTVEGQEYAIIDIGMRMLAPRELYRAQGFPDSYRIEIPFNGKPLSKSAQVRMCGNSVVPPLAAAIVRANLGSPIARKVAA